MKLTFKNLLETNLALKIVSFMFGLSFWIIFSAQFADTITVDVPLCFYGTTRTITHAPETLRVALSGKRTDLYALDFNALALHINTDSLAVGEQVLEPSAPALFLPSTVKLVHWSPLNPLVTVTEKESQTT